MNYENEAPYTEQEADSFLEELFKAAESDEAIFNGYIEQAELIVERLFDIVYENDLLDRYTPSEAIVAAQEMWDAARDIAAGVVSAEMNLQGYSGDLSYFGKAR